MADTVNPFPASHNTCITVSSIGTLDTLLKPSAYGWNPPVRTELEVVG